MKSLRFLVVGTNFISDLFCDAVKLLSDVEVEAVYSRKLDTGGAFAEKHGISAVYDNLDSALKSDRIDAVYVASPTFMHMEHSIKAMRASKHVLCEKSIALSAEELEKMIKVSAEEKRVLIEAMRPAYDPALSVIKDAMTSIGKIHRASFEFCQYSSRYDKFKAGTVENAFNPDIGNSALSDIGVYPLWLAIELFGAPERIKSEKKYLSNGFLGMGTSILGYEDKLVSVTYSKITNGAAPSVIEGELGSIIIDKISEPSEIYLAQRGKEKVKLSYTKVPNNMVYEIAAFKKMTEGKEDFLPYLKTTKRVMQAADVIHKSE